MSYKSRNYNTDEKEKKVKSSFKKKTALDKHRNLIYNITSSRVSNEDADDLSFVYVSDRKLRRR